MSRGLAVPFDVEARRAHMFPALPADLVARVTASGIEQAYDGAVVFERGDQGVPFYIVLAGALEVVHPRGVVEQPITVLGERGFSGELSVLAGRPALVRARARGAI